MTQLAVSLENTSPSALEEIKRAIALLRGVVSVKVINTDERLNVETVKAIEEAERGDTVKCNDMDEYLKLVGYGIQD